MTILAGASSTNDITPIDINYYNHEFVKGSLDTKLVRRGVVKTYIVLKGLTESAKDYTEKSIKEQDKDF